MRNRTLSQRPFNINNPFLTSQFVRVNLRAVGSRSWVNSARLQLYCLCVLERYVVTESYVTREVKTPNRQRCNRNRAAVVIYRNLRVVTTGIDHHRTRVPFVAREHLLRLSDDRRSTVDRLNSSLPHSVKYAVVVHVVANHKASLHLQIIWVHANWRFAEVSVTVNSVTDRRGIKQMVRVADVLRSRVTHRCQNVMLGDTRREIKSPFATPTGK